MAALNSTVVTIAYDGTTLAVQVAAAIQNGPQVFNLKLTDADLGLTPQQITDLTTAMTSIRDDSIAFIKTLVVIP